jgi:2-polyprenyl-3-methyl-5-hydroxy-6-metoxy-1,4-benzoquinol methylase
MAHDSFYSIASVLDLLPPNIEGMRILDVGFGNGTVIHKIVSTSIMPWAKSTGIPYVIGIDKDPEIVSFAKKWMPFYREVYLWDVTEVPYPTNICNKIDIIICTEVVEHTINKEKSLKMIEYFKTIASLVIITCPNGDDTNKLYEKEYHNHNSKWNKNDFEQFGYTTRLITQYTKEVEILLSILKKIYIGKPLYRTIVAWYKKYM